ncbi:MAG: hypothetical protein QM296_00390 [Bacillota bacterium]|nr:hypothetical protein [Bacillota bacterium]
MKRNKAKALFFVLVLLLSLIPQIHPVRVAAGGDVDINDYAFPDPVFRDYVRVFDKNKNNVLEWAELEAVKGIYCDNMGIEDLSGIEFFTRLQALNCSNNSLQTLDVSCNVELVRLRCGSNNLTDLDLFYNDLLSSNDTNFANQHCTEPLFSELNGRKVRFDLSKIPGVDLTRITGLRQYDGSALPLGATYNAATGILEMDHWVYVPGIIYDCDVRSPAHPTWRMGVEVDLWYAHYGYNVQSLVEFGEGRIEVDKAHYVMKGETVTVSTFPGEGYILGGLWAEGDSGDRIPMTGNRFTMPDEGVWVIANFIFKAFEIAVFRTGTKDAYNTGETVALAARAEDGIAPYKYQFYVIRSNGSKIILRDYSFSNIFNWIPLSPDTYTVGVSVEDTAGDIVYEEKELTVHAAPTAPPQIAVFRTGNKTSYSPGETVALAARAESGTTPYRYQFYVVRSNGSRVILRNYASSNIFNWKPVSPDTYQVGVNAQDSTGRTANQVRQITVKTPPPAQALKVAVFRAGYKSEYRIGESVALAARGEGGTAPYRYQFYVYRSNGAKVILRRFSYSNTFSWKPATPDNYRVCVAIRDAEGREVYKELPVTVKP